MARKLNNVNKDYITAICSAIGNTSAKGYKAHFTGTSTSQTPSMTSASRRWSIGQGNNSMKTTVKMIKEYIERKDDGNE